MYQMAAISFHTLHGTQSVVLTAADLAGDDATIATELDCNGEMVTVLRHGLERHRSRTRRRARCRCGDAQQPAARPRRCSTACRSRLVCTVMGIALVCETRRKGKIIVPDTIPEALLKNTPGKRVGTV